MKRALLLLVVGCGSSPASPALPISGDGSVMIWSIDATNRRDGGAGASMWSESLDSCQSQTTIGPCIVQINCNHTMPMPQLIDAGDIAIAGPTTDFTLTTTTDYSTGELGAPVFAPGDHLTFTSTGGTLPAFASDVVAPAKVAIGAPAPMGDDISFAWTGGTIGEVVVLGSDGIDGDFTFTTCRFPVSAGSGVIPRDAVPGLHGALTTIEVETRSTVVDTGWVTTVNADIEAVRADGSEAYGVLF